MRKMKFITTFGVSCGLGLSTALAGHAQTVLTVNPDGTVSQVETASPAGSRPLQSLRNQSLRNRDTQTGTAPNLLPIPERLRRGRRLNDGIGHRDNGRDRDGWNRDGRGRDDRDRGEGRYVRDEQGNIVIIGDNTDVYINQPYSGYPGYVYSYPQGGYGYPGYGYGYPYGSTTNVYISGAPQSYAYGNPYDYRVRQPYSVNALGGVIPVTPYYGYGLSYGSGVYGNGNYSSRTTTTHGGLGGGFSIGGGNTRFSIGGGRQTSTTTVTTRTFP